MPIETPRTNGDFDDAEDIQANIHGVWDWSDAKRFSHKFKKSKVVSVVLNDLSTSITTLIVTRFNSLDYIIDFVSDPFGPGLKFVLNLVKT